jgi:succinate-semialdehyde dehydrogenase / glutarate-semialdehyde dehydrogenase
MQYKSVNPVNATLLKTFNSISDSELSQKLINGHEAFLTWEKSSLDYRSNLIANIADLLRKDVEMHAKFITLEMGKPIVQARAEIEKCILLCEYYCEVAPDYLKPAIHESNAQESFVTFDPMGLIYAVMPWNFPYWQVFRFLIPNLMLGNGALLKHASNVPQCADNIEQLLLQAGIPEFVFQNLFIDYDQSDKVIGSEYVWGVTLTGSEFAGSKIAEMAGKNIKKSVLELGGSDPFIVLEDADINEAVDVGIVSRMQNAGQSCIAAKRFIVHESVYNEFLDKYTKAAQALIIGDPLNEDTYIGPIARDYLVEELQQQVNKSVEMGAKVVCGGKRSSVGESYFEPTVLVDVKEGMPAYKEEIFGPVAIIFKVSTEEEAIGIANDTEFGLGAAVWSADITIAKRIAAQIRSGTVAINGGVRSEPRLPFGGTKKSGFGRELAELGLKEFANIKTINVF